MYIMIAHAEASITDLYEVLYCSSCTMFSVLASTSSSPCLTLYGTVLVTSTRHLYSYSSPTSTTLSTGRFWYPLLTLTTPTLPLLPLPHLKVGYDSLYPTSLLLLFLYFYYPTYR